MSFMKLAGAALVVNSVLGLAQVDPPTVSSPTSLPATRTTPTLDSLDPRSRGAVVKASRNLYRCPDGTICDTSVLIEYQEVLRRSIDSTRGEVILGNGKKRTSERLGLRDTDEARAVAGNSDVTQPPLCTWWKDGKQQDVRGSWFANVDPYIVATAKLHADDDLLAGVSFASQDASFDDNIFLLRFYARTASNDISRRPSGIKPLTVYCRLDPKEFPSGRVKDGSYFIWPSHSDRTKPAAERTPQLVGGKPVTVYDLIPADLLRMSPEEVAKSVLGGELQLREWSWKRRSGTPSAAAPSYAWSMRTLQIRKQAATPTQSEPELPSNPP